MSDEYGGTAGFPCFPHPARSLISLNGPVGMNDSSLNRQEPEIAGKVAHLWFSPNCDAPSFLSTKVAKYFSAMPRFALVKNETMRLSVLIAYGGCTMLPLPRLLKVNASVR